MTKHGDPGQGDHLEAWVRWLEDGTWRVSIRTRTAAGRLSRYPMVDGADSLVEALRRVERQAVDYALLSGAALVFQTADDGEHWGLGSQPPLPF